MFPFRPAWSVNRLLSSFTTNSAFPNAFNRLIKCYSRLHLRKSNRFFDVMSAAAVPEGKSKKRNEKILVAFDFDKTLIDVNSDTYVLRLLPDGGKEAHKHHNLQWTAYMQKIFDLLCLAGVKPEDLFACLGQIPWTGGMKELVMQLNENGHDVIIISDCNAIFINSFLSACKMENYFERIYTNPAEFDSRGCLHISMYHRQDWCELSAVNLCKGHILDEFIGEKTKFGDFKYKFVAYVGDGLNDYCPMLRLSASDLAFPRLDYPCQKQILSETRTKYKMKAKVIPWQNGFQVRDAIFQLLQ